MNRKLKRNLQIKTFVKWEEMPLTAVLILIVHILFLLFI
jgi:hypothetical protein